MSDSKGGGLLRGLEHLLRLATDLADHAQREDGTVHVEVNRAGSTGIPKTLRAVYGVSVRMGARGRPIPDASREPMTDVLDEGDHYLVVVELPGIDATTVEWALRGDRLLVITAGAIPRRYSRTIGLADAVDEQSVVSCYANGVLELKLWKQHA